MIIYKKKTNLKRSIYEGKKKQNNSRQLPQRIRFKSKLKMWIIIIKPSSLLQLIILSSAKIVTQQNMSILIKTRNNQNQNKITSKHIIPDQNQKTYLM